MAYTEFFCNHNAGDNRNAGSTDAAASLTSTNGAWTQSTRVFEASDAPDLSGVSVGEWASVRADGGSSTDSAFVGQISGVDNTAKTVTLHSSRIFGTNPGNAANGMTLRIGGPWKGPSTTNNFPFTISTNPFGTALSGDGVSPARLNLKSNEAFTIAAVITMASGGLYVIQGYTTTPGDGGKFTIDGNSSAINCVNVGITATIRDGIIFNDASSGTNYGLRLGGAGSFAERIECLGHRGSGVSVGGNYQTLLECDIHDNNTSSNAAHGGINTDSFPGGINILNCRIYDNDDNGIIIAPATGGQWHFAHCLIYGNNGPGISLGTTTQAILSVINSDFYANAGSGIQLGNTSGQLRAMNSNFIDNGAYGIDVVSAVPRNHEAHFCGFGAGTMANVSGNFNGSVQQSNNVTYADDVTPWTDPGNGDFRLNLAAALGAGRLVIPGG